MELSQKQKEDQRIRKIQRKVLEGEVEEGDWEYRHLFNEGQKSGVPLVLDTRDSEADHIVAVVEDSMEDHSVAGTVGTFSAIVKGKCNHCGSNRLKVSHNEPAGIGCVSCPVCNRDDMSSKYEFDYEVDRE